MASLILRFDKLPAFLLGCYGQLRLPTPQFDAFAASSIVCEHVYATEPITAGNRGVSLFATAEELQALLRETASATTLNVDVTATTVTRTSLRTAWRALVETDGGDRLRELENRFSTLPQQVERKQIGGWTLGRGETWEEPLLWAAANAVDADQFVGRLRSLLGTTEAAFPVILTATSGTAAAEPSQGPDWLKQVGEAATHVPWIEHIPKQSSRRERGVRSLGECLAQSSCLNAERVEPLLMATAKTRSLRSDRWWLVEHLATAIGEDSDVRLFRQPEDPWGVRSVSGEHLDLIDHYRATGQLP